MQIHNYLKITSPNGDVALLARGVPNLDEAVSRAEDVARVDELARSQGVALISTVRTYRGHHVDARHYHVPPGVDARAFLARTLEIARSMVDASFENTASAVAPEPTQEPTPTDTAPDPSEHTVSSASDLIQDMGTGTLRAFRQAELDGKARTTLLAAIDAELARRAEPTESDNKDNANNNLLI